MKLPNPQNLVIDLHKLRGYCLNPDDRRGQHKARLFASILGITEENAEELANILRLTALSHEANLGELDQYGQRYTVDFSLTRQGNTALIRSCWIVRPDENFPRLTSCYILKKSWL